MQKTRRDMQRRTRRNASTIGGAAPDTTIDRAAADRSGARPYHATRAVSEACDAGSAIKRPALVGTRSRANQVAFIECLLIRAQTSQLPIFPDLARRRRLLELPD